MLVAQHLLPHHLLRTKNAGQHNPWLVWDPFLHCPKVSQACCILEEMHPNIQLWQTSVVFGGYLHGTNLEWALFSLIFSSAEGLQNPETPMKTYKRNSNRFFWQKAREDDLQAHNQCIGTSRKEEHHVTVFPKRFLWTARQTDDVANQRCACS